jgi:hypothetical protein
MNTLGQGNTIQDVNASISASGRQLVAGQESLDTVEEKEHPAAGTFDGIQNRTSGTIKPGQSSRGSMRKSQQASAEQPVPKV